MKTEKPGYWDSPVNLLADAIAERMGGKHVALNPDGEYFEVWAVIAFDETPERPACTLSLSMRGFGVKRDTVTARVSPNRRSNDVYGIKFPKASFDSKKPIDAIVKDLTRRVLNSEAIAALRQYAEKIAELDARKNGAAETLAQMQKDFPRAHFPEPGRKEQSFQISSSAATTGYFYATVTQYQDGPSVHFERIGSVTFEQAKKILAILCEPSKTGEA